MDFVSLILRFCVPLILKVDHQIVMPKSEAELNKLAAGWSYKSIQRFGIDLMPGTVLASDGLDIEIQAPTEDNRDNIDLAKFRNRHGLVL